MILSKTDWRHMKFETCQMFLSFWEIEKVCGVCAIPQKVSAEKWNQSEWTVVRLCICSFSVCGICAAIRSTGLSCLAIYNPLRELHQFMIWATDSRCWGGSGSIQRCEWMERNHSAKLYLVGRTCRRAFTQKVRIRVDGMLYRVVGQGRLCYLSLEF